MTLLQVIKQRDAEIKLLLNRIKARIGNLTVDVAYVGVDPRIVVKLDGEPEVSLVMTSEIAAALATHLISITKNHPDGV